MIESALMSGFTAVGMDVFLLGPMPTPAVAMLTRSLRADLGVMISASHNPYDDNGIKLFDPDGYKLSDDAEGQIEALMDGADRRAAGPRRPDRPRQAHRERAGALYRVRQAHAAAQHSPQRSARRRRLRQRRRPTRWRPTRFGSWAPRSSRSASSPTATTSTTSAARPRPEALCDKVREMRADIGIALDGDADRVVIVDEKGAVVDGDQIMAVIAESWHRRGKLAGRRRRGDGDVATSASSAISTSSASPWCAPRSATATSSSTCASTATTSAASSRATSSSPTSPPPATAWSPRCRCWPSSSARASR